MSTPSNTRRAVTKSSWIALVGTLATAAVTFGLLTTDQSQLVQEIAAGVGALITLVTALVHSFASAKHADQDGKP